MGDYDEDWGDDSNTNGVETTSYGGGGGGYSGGGGGGGDRSCFKCNQTGHISRDCPSGGGGGGGGDRACYKCQQTGHMARECPNAEDGGGGGRRGGGSGECFKCKETGHMARDCPNAEDGGGGRRGGNECYKCKEEGHMARDCPNDDGSGDAGRRPRSDNCYKCQQPGHMARDCTEEPVEGAPRRGGGDGNCFKCKEPGHISRDCPNPPAEMEPGADGKPRERYDPPPMLDGDDAFTERNQTHSGSGINFNQYDNIPVNVSGENCPPPVGSFQQLNLRPLLLTNLTKCGYTKPTPIQRTACPALLAGRDVMACAQTGSGKTASFLLPILHKIMEDDDMTPSMTIPATPECLILAPTRELAIQIGKESHTYALGSCVKTRVIYGGTTIYTQKSQLNSGCNVLVATPGRLNQFLNEGHVSLKNVKYFILDEADRMLDMGFMPDVQKIVDQMTPKGTRVSGMFSATFPEEIQRTATALLNNYVFITVGIVGGACKDVEQTFIETERTEKRGKLMDILKATGDDEKILIFCASKKGADFLATSLSNAKLSSTSIHGDRLQSQRELALREFTTGVRKILVATAVAARGLDIPKVSMVVNYDMPTDIDEYVHRIGRTGRVGNVGRAISFFDSANDSAIAGPLVAILKGAGQEVPSWLESQGYGDGPGLDAFGGTDARGAAAAAGGDDDDEDW